MTYSTYYSSPIGVLMLASDGEKLIGLWVEDQKYFAATVKDDIEEKNDLPVFIAVKKWLDSYFSGEKPEIPESLLAPSGGEFRKKIWDVLCEIPYGEVVTYGDIAKKMAKIRGKEKMSAQAVGGAVGHNPISIIIPCHRVVGAKGSLTGYASGIDRKIKLLKHEKLDMSNLYVPSKGTAL